MIFLAKIRQITPPQKKNKKEGNKSQQFREQRKDDVWLIQNSATGKHVYTTKGVIRRKNKDLFAYLSVNWLVSRA